MTSFRILVRAGQQWVANRDARLGAALAYYTIFSIAPLLVLAVHIAGLIYGEEAARGHVAARLRDAVGTQAAQAVETLLEHAGQPRLGRTWAAYAGLLVTIIGALGLFLHLRAALCTIWRLEPPRGSTLLGILLDYTLAIIMVLVTGLLLLASVAAATVLALLSKYMENVLPVGVPWHLLEMAVSFVFLTLLFAAVYRILSGQRIAWRYVWYGAAIASLLFTVGKTLLGLYLAYTSTASLYGAAGSLVVFLVWVYYSSQILYFGAELIQARRTRSEWLNAKT